MAEGYQFPLVKTPAGICTLIGKGKHKDSGKDMIVVQQGIREQMAGGIPYDKTKKPCATWIFGVCWTHKKIFALKYSCGKCAEEANAGT